MPSTIRPVGTSHRSLHSEHSQRTTRHQFIAAALLHLAPLWALSQNLPDPDSILVGNEPRPKVLLVGTFHFEYYDLDAHVTAKDNRVNVREPKRQHEMEELLDYIARFKPTMARPANILRSRLMLSMTGTMTLSSFLAWR